MGLPPELAFVFGETENVFQRTHIVSREMVAESTLALTIARPTDFEFTPGQNTLVSIPGPHAEHLKELTIASAPYEREIVLATRIRNSKFKDALYALRVGDAITLRSASGGLWSESAAPQVWLSGGIGITPFRSIVRELIHTGGPLDVTHIHSDRSHARVPFAAEFESYTREHSGYQFIPTMTSEARQDERKGRINADMLTELVPTHAECTFSVVGSESFVASMRSVLATLGISQSCIRTERFEGYRS